MITGAGAGIGRGCALRFGAEGAKVVVADINAAGAEETARLVGAAGGTAAACATDVSSEESVAALAAFAVRTFGAVHVLLNNAAIQVNKTVEDTTLVSGGGGGAGRSLRAGGRGAARLRGPPLVLCIRLRCCDSRVPGSGARPTRPPQSQAEWNREIGVNLGGVFLCSKHFMRHLRATRGNIISMSSVNATFVEPMCAGYCATKAAIIGLTKCARGAVALAAAAGTE